MKIFEAPIFGFGSPDDGYFRIFKQSSVIGEHFILPREWLPDAKTVISFFLPFSAAVKKGNKRDASWPSEEWLHGRIEGQVFLNRLCMYLKSELEKSGYESLVPSLDKRFWSKTGATSNSPHPEPTFTSTWSERHVAFVCGLGTFGLSKGLITSKGMAGRFGSILTELYLPPDKRPYDSIHEYCSMCGACAKNCPVHAITMEEGKNHVICSDFLDQTAVKYKPRYGCGKCQVKVPCESRIPNKNKEVVPFKQFP
jgi:epoxyqueuosine reductase QueG